MGRFLGLDVGSKRIGVAVSDSSAKIALGLTILHRTNQKSDISHLLSIIREREITDIVVGLPLNLKGEKGYIAQQVEKFIEKCQKKIDKKFVYWDERFSSAQIEKEMIFAGVRTKKRKEPLDEQAAQLILQGYLDFMNGSRVEHRPPVS